MNLLDNLKTVRKLTITLKDKVNDNNYEWLQSETDDWVVQRLLP